MDGSLPLEDFFGRSRILPIIFRVVRNIVLLNLIWFGSLEIELGREGGGGGHGPLAGFYAAEFSNFGTTVFNISLS